jgi:hypothetical protein
VRVENEPRARRTLGGEASGLYTSFDVESLREVREDARPCEYSEDYNRTNRRASTCVLETESS